MGAPKIKLYQLPVGYSEDSDNDIQQVENDELLPVKDKPITPEDFYELTGIKEISEEILSPINMSAGKVFGTLLPYEEAFQAPHTNDTDILLVGENSYYVAEVYDNTLELIPPSGYNLTPSGVQFLSAPYPSGATIQYWRADTEPCVDFVTENYAVYNAGNKMFKPILIDNSDNIFGESEYTLIAASGHITFDIAQTSPKMSYAYESETTRYYIGHRENWIPPNSDNASGGHLYMGPDVFKGMYDYPGDDTEDTQGNPIVQGEIPQFVERGGYQIDFRKGLVTFPEEFNNTTYSVHASFAYLVGIRNVTNQVLDQIVAASGNYQYKAVSDKMFSGSIDSRWVDRDDSYLPRNFYVNGELKPQILTVTPYDTLEVEL